MSTLEQVAQRVGSQVWLQTEQAWGQVRRQVWEQVWARVVWQIHHQVEQPARRQAGLPFDLRGQPWVQYEHGLRWVPYEHS